LKVNNPKVAPPRVVSSPNLLTGICHCGNCGGAMTLRTGKNGRYRYYACSIRARQGETGCKGRAIPMDKLDRIVVSRGKATRPRADRKRSRLLLDRRQEGVERRSQHIAELNHRAAEADNRLKRLYDAIEAGSLDPAESSLGERIADLTARFGIRRGQMPRGSKPCSQAPLISVSRGLPCGNWRAKCAPGSGSIRAAIGGNRSGLSHSASRLLTTRSISKGTKTSYCERW